MKSIKAIELHKDKNHLILIAAIPFKELKDIIVFTQRSSSDWVDDELKSEGRQYYQRPISSDRVKNIKKYIEDSIFNKEKFDQVLFPSSTILSFDLDESKLEFMESVVDLTVPNEKESCLIVDGQHRMRAMIELYEEYNKHNLIRSEVNKILEYKFNCTILIGYDLWEQAQIFADVNFNQKPVDRSLYYDIFGSAPRDGKNEKFNNLYVAHELGKFLNSSEKSPLKGFVKDFNSKEGFYSQAFFTQHIVKLLGFRGEWFRIIEDFKLGDNGLGFYKKLPKIFVAYYNVIKDVFPDYWPKGNKNKDATLLIKTTSMGALLRLLGRINEVLAYGLYQNKGKIDLIDLSMEELENLFKELFIVFNPETKEGKELADKFFGENSPYKGGGGAGLQSKLFRELAEVIGIPITKSSNSNK